MILKRNSVMQLLAVFSLIFGASLVSTQPAYAIADQTVNCSGGGTFSIVNNAVTTSTLTCAGSVDIPSGVTSIANNAFSRLGKTSVEQQSITSVTIPNTVITIGTSAFRDCQSASSLTIGTAVTSIGADAFNNFIGLNTLVIPGSVQTIGARAFANVNLTTLTLNEGLTTIGNSAFLGNKLVTLVIPNSVTTISTEAAFAGYGFIETLTLGSGLTTIGNRTFEGVGRLQSLTIPSGVTSLGADAFKNYPQTTYRYCGTALSTTILDSAGLTGKTKFCQTAQTINLASTKSSMPYNETATLTTSGTSGSGAITYSTSGSCSVTGNTLQATGSSDNCTVSATIAADATYAAATSSTLTIPLSKANQANLVASQVTSTSTWNGTAYTAVPTFSTTGGTDNGAVTYSVTNLSATGCTLSNATATATLTASTSGTCTITATKAATTNYNSATSTLVFTFAAKVDGDAAEAAANAAKAASEAAAAKHEAEKRDARAEMLSRYKGSEAVTVETYQKAEIVGITTSNVDEFNKEILRLPIEQRGDLAEISRVARKYEVVGLIGSDRVKSVYPSQYIEIGLISADSKIKSTLVKAVCGLAENQRSSYEAIKAAIEVETKKIQVRQERLAAIISRNSTRATR